MPSPRGWGNQLQESDRDLQARAIPTWVGKSRSMGMSQRMYSGHPHVGGEIAVMLSFQFVENGPSPRGWGNRDEGEHERLLGRAIPTWVGKSRSTPP